MQAFFCNNGAVIDRAIGTLGDYSFCLLSLHFLYFPLDPRNRRQQIIRYTQKCTCNEKCRGRKARICHKR
ncbi:hypothetical protein GOP47_0005035 [Adiantum capillus-veneris]|uniref:Uncharacterized protein n=1 Tax=Adiantum capillus-veneris TaxID=13818 RepID=A0A9D4ZN90_ADICA|nr:hypothetical protein GOP47_0005035 [Adiantum capillus-veneris]